MRLLLVVIRGGDRHDRSGCTSFAQVDELLEYVTLRLAADEQFRVRQTVVCRRVRIIHLAVALGHLVVQLALILPGLLLSRGLLTEETLASSVDLVVGVLLGAHDDSLSRSR